MTPEPTAEEVRNAYRLAWTGISPENRALLRARKPTSLDPTIRQLRSEAKRLRGLGFNLKDANLRAVNEQLRAKERVVQRRDYRAALAAPHLTPEELDLAAEMLAAREARTLAESDRVPVSESWRARWHTRKHPRRVRNGRIVGRMEVV